MASVFEGNEVVFKNRPLIFRTFESGENLDHMYPQPRKPRVRKPDESSDYYDEEYSDEF